MEFDDEPDDDESFEPPLPPDDRLWRHPSEMGAAAAGTRIELVTRRPTGPLVLASAQALLALLVLLWSGMRRFGAPRAVEPPIEPGKRFLIENTAGRRDDFVRDQAREALNFQLNVLLLNLVALVTLTAVSSPATRERGQAAAERERRDAKAGAPAA